MNAAERTLLQMIATALARLMTHLEGKSLLSEDIEQQVEICRKHLYKDLH